MAQHDFAPAWLSFPTPPPSTKPSSANHEKERVLDHVPRHESKTNPSRRRHNSSDAFLEQAFPRSLSDSGSRGSSNHGSQHGCWRPSGRVPDAGVTRTIHPDSNSARGTSYQGDNGSHRGLYHSESASDRRSGRYGDLDTPRRSFHTSGSSRSRNGHYHGGKSRRAGDDTSAGPQEDSARKEEKDTQKQFEVEDFPSLNPEADKSKGASVPAGVWENPPNPKPRASTLMIIRKLSREDSTTGSGTPILGSVAVVRAPQLTTSATIVSGVCGNGGLGKAAQSTGGITAVAGNKVSPGIAVPGTGVYKILVPKPVTPASKYNWKATGGGKEHWQSSRFAKDSAFKLYSQFPKAPGAPVSVTSPLSDNSQVPLRSSSTSPIDASGPRLTRLGRRADRKSEFLRALKQGGRDDEPYGEERYDSPSLEQQNENLSGANNGLVLHKNETETESQDGSLHSDPTDDAEGWTVQAWPDGGVLAATASEGNFLSSSLEAEHRLLKEMGWQEFCDDECSTPLTEDEMREFQRIKEKLQMNGLRRNGLRKNGPVAVSPGVAFAFPSWKAALSMQGEVETDSTSSDTSDDDI
uniref:vasculin-like isoform X2 n=1 Tax=Myxine glutinosa TaxID=7769 RepID=UPI00358EC012